MLSGLVSVHMICINWTKAHSSFIHACADLWTCIVRCHSGVAGCAYYLYYCIIGILFKLDPFHVCSKEYYDISNEIKLLVLQFWVWSASSFFVLVTSDSGLEEQKWKFLFSAVLWGDEKIPISRWTVSPTSRPRYMLPSIQFINYLFPLLLGFVTLQKVWIQWCQAAVQSTCLSGVIWYF